jgi:hypothetical protein
VEIGRRGPGEPWKKAAGSAVSVTPPIGVANYLEKHFGEPAAELMSSPMVAR